MAIPANQIGRGTEENLLWQISKQLEALTGVTYNSKKYLLNVTDPYYNNPNLKTKIETFSGVWSGEYVNYDTSTTPFLTIDLTQTSSLIMEFSSYSFNGEAATGIFYISSRGTTVYQGQTLVSFGNATQPIQFNQDGNLVNFYLYSQDYETGAVEIAYTVKAFTLPMYND